MISPGTPCYVVDDGGEYTSFARAYIGHVCTVTHLGSFVPGCVCTVLSHDGQKLGVERWSILRPIIPPGSTTDERTNEREPATAHV